MVNPFSILRQDQLIAYLLALSMLILSGLKMVAPDVNVEIIIKEPEKVNINTATQMELETLPRIGPKLAKRIIEYREKYGGFKSIEEIVKVKGIGKETFSKLKNLITVEGTNETTD